MGVNPISRQCSLAYRSNPTEHRTSDSSARSIRFQPLTSSTLPNPDQLSPSLSDILFTMSGSSGSSSRNWDDLLAHGSALGILKPDVAFPPYGGGSTSGNASGSASGGPAAPSGGSTNPSGGQTSGGDKR